MNLVEASVSRASAVGFGDTTLDLAGAEALGERRVALGIRPTSFARRRRRLRPELAADDAREST